MIEFSFLFYCLVTLSLFITDIIRFGRKWYDPLYVYLVAVSLYVVPLSLRYLLQIEPSGNITYLFYDIEAVYPYALFLTATANVVFYLFYLYSFNEAKEKIVKSDSIWSMVNFKLAAIFILSIGAIGFFLLIMTVGGVKAFFLAGYGVTAKLSSNPALATSIPILFVGSFMLLGSAHKAQSKSLFVISVIIFTTLIIINLALGRRAEIASWGISGCIYYCLIYRDIGFKKIFPLVILGFIFLNFVGVVRQSSFESFEAIVERVVEKKTGVNESNYGLFYTLIDGQFTVPFEVLPVLMEHKESIEYRYGSTVLESIALWIPRALWADKPYGLTSWYYRLFYDPSAPPNEGRAFFFLAEGFLNFGILGVIIWAAISGVFWKYMSNHMIQKSSYFTCFVAAIYVGNMHKLVASSSGAIFVTIPKQTIIWFIAGVLFALIVQVMTKTLKR